MGPQVQSQIHDDLHESFLQIQLLSCTIKNKQKISQTNI